MGEEVEAQEFSRADRTRYREKVRRCLDVFARMLREARFDTDDPMTGLEVELNLVDELGDPALKNAEALAAIADPDFQTELGQFNIEINVPPAKLREGGLATFEENLRRSLNDAEAKSAEVGAHLVMIGILPTLADGHMSPSSISANPRYKLLSEQILNARGEDITIAIARHRSGSRRPPTRSCPRPPAPAPSSTCRPRPTSFAEYWNASQAICGDPARGGRQLAVPARQGAVARDPDPAVRAGDRHPQRGAARRRGCGRGCGSASAGSPRSSTCSRRTSATSRRCCPITDDEDPLAVLEDGGVPTLSELRLHNGTIYRWNRPVYDIAGGVPHLRVENRVLAAGPTVADTMANAAFYFGLVRALAESERPLWSQMSFSAAEENFHVAAQHGIDAPGLLARVGQVRATELILRRLLPLAREGLAAWGVRPRSRDRLLGIIEQRCLTGHQRRRVVRPPDAPARRQDRFDALRGTLLEYRERMHTNEPVHTWD